MSQSNITPEVLHSLIQASFKGTSRSTLHLIIEDVTSEADPFRSGQSIRAILQVQVYHPHYPAGITRLTSSVGAALLLADGSMVIGCNVENAATPAGICAERTAMVKAISDGSASVLAVAVTSNLPTPTISPCGICRQFMREFLPLSAPILMVSATYPLAVSQTPDYVSDLGEHIAQRGAANEELGGSKKEVASRSWSKEIRVLSLGELLPMSFGPDQLLADQPKASG